MTPFKQLLTHDPKRGVYGDCHRTAIGSIFDIPPEQMPHFYDRDRTEDQARQLVDEWLAARGLTQILLPFWEGGNHADSLGDVLSKVSRWNSGQYHLLSGTSRNSLGHSVVCLDGVIVHDPAPTDGGIIGPLDDGCYWVTFFGSSLASSRRTARRRPTKRSSAFARAGFTQAGSETGAPTFKPTKGNDNYSV